MIAPKVQKPTAAEELALLERLFAHVAPAGPFDCWLWTGGTNGGGYGRMGSGGRTAPTVYPHRLAYTLMVAEIPDGLELDHLCRTPLCVNPQHLDPVPRLVNMRRRFDTETCKRGHAWTEENTYRPPRGRRMCRACIELRKMVEA